MFINQYMQFIYIIWKKCNGNLFIYNAVSLHSNIIICLITIHGIIANCFVNTVKMNCRYMLPDFWYDMIYLRKLSTVKKYTETWLVSSSIICWIKGQFGYIYQLAYILIKCSMFLQLSNRMLQFARLKLMTEWN